MTHEALVVGPGNPEPSKQDPATDAHARQSGLRGIADRIRDTPRAARLPWVVMGAATLAILYNSWRLRFQQHDDSYIYDRYFWNVEHGHGLVYNVGQHFDGLTSPLYTYVMIAVGLVVRNPFDASWGVAVVCFTGAAWFLFRYGDRRGNGLAYSLGLLVGFALPYFYLTYGMETGLLLLLIAACLYLFETSRYGWLLVCGTLLALTRTEDGLLLVALAAEHLIKRRPLPSWRVLIAPAIILAAHFTFQRVYYGAFFPSTDMAKVWQGESGLWGTEKPIFLNVSYFPDMLFYGERWLWVSVLLLAVVGCVARWRKLRPLLLFCALYLGFFCVLNLPNYHWYYAPLFLGGFVCVGCGIETLGHGAAKLAALAARPAWRTRLAGATGVATAMVFLVAGTGQAYADAGDRVPVYHRIGLWMDANLPADASVAADEVGVVGYYSHRQIVDILGLVNPYNARYIGERKFTKWLTKYHPDYYLVHDPITDWPEEVGVRQLVDQGELWIYQGFDFAGTNLYCLPGEPGCVPLPAGYVAP